MLTAAMLFTVLPADGAKGFQILFIDGVPYHRVFFSVVLWDGDVVVGGFRPVCCRLLSVPHDRVQVWKVMVQVDSFIGVSSFSPAGQF